MAFEAVIGLEVHAQLLTDTKIFCGCPTSFGAAPNTHVCPVCLGLPGALPVLNRRAVELGTRAALALGCRINEHSIFARKNYFYPDLPKGYQISQYEIPIVQRGSVTIATEAGEKTIRLTRAHLEEDAGKSLHEGLPAGAGDVTGIDLNRAGTPLLEIVSEPDLRSSAEAIAYAKKLHALVMWIGICDGNMQEGSFRCDANVSVRRPGAPLGTRCEIKNLNSFRFMQQAIDYEVRRQIELIEDGGTVVQETRLYDPDRNETRPMRGKEDAQDYRYFPDPDLPPLVVGDAWIARMRRDMPELPDAMRTRLVAAHGLTDYDAAQLTSSHDLAEYYAGVCAALDAHDAAACKPVANWVLGEFSASLNRTGTAVADAPVAPEMLAALLRRIADGTLSGKMAKQVFDALWTGDGEITGATGAEVVDAMIDRRGLRQVSDAGAIEALVDAVIAAQPAVVAEFRVGKEKAFNALVGHVMKASKGKANPGEVNAMLRRKLAG